MSPHADMTAHASADGDVRPPNPPLGCAGEGVPASCCVSINVAREYARPPLQPRHFSHSHRIRNAQEAAHVARTDLLLAQRETCVTLISC